MRLADRISIFSRAARCAHSLLLLSAVPVLAQSSVTLRTVERDGVPFVELSNDKIELRIEPGRGGRIVSFHPNFSVKDWKHPEPSFGIALDHFAGQGHPGELDGVTYDYRLFDEQDGKGVELWATTREGRLGVPVGLKVTKRIALRPDSPVIYLTYTLTNTGATTVRPGFMPKFDIYVSGEAAENYYYRPTTHGLSIVPAQSKTSEQDFVKDPIAGWTAALNRRTGEGIVFLMDYNYLQWLYNCTSYNTIEWIYDRVTLPPGGSWTTNVQLVPFYGLNALCHASARLLAETEVTEREGHVTVCHRLLPVNGALFDVHIKTEVTQITTLRHYDLPQAKLGQVSNRAASATVESRLNEHSGLTFTVTISGQDNQRQPFIEQYDYYYRGREGGGFNLLTGGERGYFRPAPRKVKQFPRPQGLTFSPVQPPEVFEMRGLFGDLYQVESAAAQRGMRLTRKSYAQLSWAGASVDDFPFDLTQLFRFSVVVINNIDGGAIDAEMEFMLEEYVKAGGGLLILGGYYGFGVGGLDQLAGLSKMLPATMSGAFDLKALAGSRVVRDAPGGLFNETDFAEMGEVAWVHHLSPKPHAEVQARVGKLPFIITGSFGKGRVAVVTGTMLGKPRLPGGRLFFTTDAWLRNLGKLLSWLGKVEEIGE